MKKPLLQFLTFILVFLCFGISFSFAQERERADGSKMPIRNANSKITYLDSYIHQPNVEECLKVSVIFDVKDENGSPVNDAIVTFNGVENAQGDYIFQGITEGNYHYNIIKEGYNKIDDEILIISEKSELLVSITLVVETFTITFKVADDDGKDITDAFVTFNEEKNDAGNYIFDGIKAGIYDYKVEREYHNTIAGQLDVSKDSTVSVTLVAQRFIITFNIADEDGNEITDAIVTFDGIEKDAGDYIFWGIKAGTFNYKVEREGFNTVEGQQTVTGDTTVNVNLVVESFKVSFNILDEDEKEIIDAVVTFNSIVNDAGNYNFESIKAGTYEYKVEKEGYLTLDGQLSITGDTTIKVTLIAETYTVIFKIADVNDAGIADAQITFNNKKNSAGDYTFMGIKAGTYNYKVEKAGFIPIEGQAEVIDQNLTISVILPDSTSTTTNLLSEQCISLLPNPNTGRFILELSVKPGISKIWLTVLDPTGRVVHRVEENSQGETFTKELDLSFLSSGFYYIHIQDNQRTGVKKLIIN